MTDKKFFFLHKKIVPKMALLKLEYISNYTKMTYDYLNVLNMG
jgi:hypothetical protein